jgi:tetratricopeptide (TPR) repeat protein
VLSNNRIFPSKLLLFCCSLILVPTVEAASPAAKPAPKPTANKTAPQDSQKPAMQSEWQNLRKAADALSVNANYTDAESKYQEALAAAEKTGDNNAIVACLVSLANCMSAEDNKLADELPIRIRAKELSEKLYGAKSSRCAERVADLADVYARKGEIEQARENTDLAMQVLGQSDEQHPLEMAAYYQSLASRQIAASTFGLAEEPMKKAVELRSQKLSANDPLLINTLSRYANLLKKLGQDEEARKVQDRITLARVLPGADSAKGGSTPAGNSAFAKLLQAATEADKSGDQEKSIAAWRLVVQEAEKSNDARLPYALVHLGDHYLAQKNKDEALALYKRGLELREKSGSTKTLGMSRNLKRIAAQQIQANSSESERLYSRALEVEDQVNAPDLLLGMTLQNMLSADMMSKNNAKVEQVSKRMLQLADKIGGAFGSMQKRMALGMLGSAYMSSGRQSEGMQLLKSISQLPNPTGADFQKSLQESYSKAEELYEDSEKSSLPK